MIYISLFRLPCKGIFYFLLSILVYDNKIIASIETQKAYKVNVISGAQCRMARGLLKWSVSELADQADLGQSTIKRIENTDGILQEAQISTLEAIYQAFHATGRVRFEGVDGVFLVDAK